MQRDPFDLVGDLLDGQFRVESLAGEGELSVVYRGHHIGVDAPVAIKCLNLPETLDPALMQPLVRGFKEASRMHYRLARGHLHIAQTIASGTTVAPRTGAAIAYLVREWFEGESLSSNLARRRAEGRSGRPLEETLALLETAFDAMAYAHAQGDVHLSISPGNLFLNQGAGAGRAPSLKVLDFGMARTMGAFDPRAQGTGLHLFAPAYAAPEQFDRTVGALGPATDVYALALVMMEVLSDRVVMAPAEAATLAERALDDRRRPTPEGHGLNLPPHVARALARAVSRAPERRQKSAADLWRDVKGPVRTTPLGSMFVVPPRPVDAPGPHTAPAPPALGQPAVTRPRAPTMAGLNPAAPPMATTYRATTVATAAEPAAESATATTPATAAATAIANASALAVAIAPDPEPSEPAELLSAVSIRTESIASLPPSEVREDDPPEPPPLPPKRASPRELLRRSVERVKRLRPPTYLTHRVAALSAQLRFAPLRPVVYVVGAVFALAALALWIGLSGRLRASAAAKVTPVPAVPEVSSALSRSSALPAAPTRNEPEASDPPAPEAPAAVGSAFERRAAVLALDTKWRKVARCRRGKAWGKTWTTVTFANDGAVDRVEVGWPFGGTPTSTCIANTLGEARVAPFRGAGVLAYRVWVAP